MFDPKDMDRRALMARALMLVGAAVVPANIEALAAAPLGAGKRFLTPVRFALMSAVADTIIPATDTPGALGTGVPAKLDAMLANWASADTRKQIGDALARIDGAARRAQKKGFAALTRAQRISLLKTHDAAALKKTPPPPGAPKTNNPFAPAIYVADNGYFKLKDLVIALYYNSEVAMTRELIYEHVPGTWQPSIKIIDNTRPWASTGPF